MMQQFDDNSSAKPAQKPQGRLVLWLFVSSLLGGFLPLLLVYSMLTDANIALTDTIAVQQSTLSAPARVNPEREALSSQLSALRTEYSALETVSNDLTHNQFDVTSIMSGFGEFQAGQLVLTGMAQNDLNFTLEGLAVDEASVMAYVIHLREDNRFDEVTMQSIIRDVTEYGEPFNSFVIHIQIVSESDTGD